MALTNSGRAAAIYAAVQGNNPNFAKLSDPEKQQLRSSMEAIFGAGDLSYLLANTVVLPATMQNPSGQPVATTGGPAAQSGATTAPATIIGTGKLS